MQKLIEKWMGYWSNKKAPVIWEWILLAVLILIPFVCCFYGDTASILKYQVNFWGAIFDGEGFRSFYDYCMMKSEQGGINGLGNLATYDFPMYLVLGLWGLPLWIFQGAGGIDSATSFTAKLYGKSIFLAALCITAYLVYRICRELKLEKKNAVWGAFLYASSLMIYVAVCLNGQTDILGIIFILLGILFFIKDKRLLFVIFFAVAVPFKQYALFIYLPLLLLIEKKIWKILLYTGAVLSVLAGSSLLFDPASPAIIAKKQFELDMFNRLTVNRLPLMNGSVPVVGAMLLAVCVFCYLKQLKDKEELNRYTVFIPLLTMGLVFTSFESSSYWYVHLTPYLAILLVYHPKALKTGLLFETAAMACLTLANYASRPWAFNPNHYLEMTLDKLFGNYLQLENPLMLDGLMGKIGIIKYCGFFFGIYVVLLYAFIYIYRPSRLERGEIEEPVRLYAGGRLLINAVVAFIPLLLYLYNVYMARTM